MDKFLSCDWGTSSFRLRLVQRADLAIIRESASGQGIADTFASWKKAGIMEEQRLSFYLDFVFAHVREFEKILGYPLAGTPMVLSGMAGSSIGMKELPYKKIPFAIDGSDLIVKVLGDIDSSHSNIIMISGAATGDDVMRGEETQAIGCSHDIEKTGQSLFIFPGTHSKHIAVESEKAVGFKTYMTGEYFKLLSTKSILSVSVEEGSELRDDKSKRSFQNGIEESVKTNLLHSSFQVRTNQLFNKLSKEQNYYFLSGLLIGTEVKELMNQNYKRIVLVATERVGPFYETAIKMLNPETLLEIEDADKALIRGQFRILMRFQ